MARIDQVGDSIKATGKDSTAFVSTISGASALCGATAMPMMLRSWTINRRAV